MTNQRSIHTRWQFILAALVVVAGFAVQVIRQPTSAEGLLRMTVLDIGQGDAILVDFPDGEHMLVDAGPHDAVMPALARDLAPPEEFALLVATHNDADHIGGFPAVLDHYPSQEIWISGAIHTTATYQRWLDAMQASNAHVQVVSSGYTESFGEVRISVLFPLDSQVGVRPENNNDTTIVIKIQYGAAGILLTGDLDSEHEDKIIAAHSAELPSQVLKVTHHGSKYGTSSRFLNYVQPKIALISVGKDNRYGHPHQELLDRLSARAIPTYRTDESGDLTIFTNGALIWYESGQTGRQLVE